MKNRILAKELYKVYCMAPSERPLRYQKYGRFGKQFGELVSFRCQICWEYTDSEHIITNPREGSRRLPDHLSEDGQFICCTCYAECCNGD